MVSMPIQILIVDDDVEVRRSLKTVLQFLGYDVVAETDNGISALQILRTRKVDIVLADWYLPIMDGMELCKAMRTDANLADIPVLLVTGDDRGETEALAASAGANTVLTKPFSGKMLEEKLKELKNCVIL